MTAPTHDVDALVAHLARRRLVATGAEVTVRPLAGGVSNDVVAVTAPGLDAVVKRALARLRVSDEWLADPARLDAEGRALRLAGRLAPGLVPQVYDLSDGYLVIERAPAQWHPWKQDLLAGRVDLATARDLGRALGRWQAATVGNADVAAQFADRTAFTQLRVDPFHRTVAARHPDLAGPINDTVEAMGAARVCLVHGDYTPKNVLVAPDGGLWVIDWEVAHLGDPTFDPAWVVGHLLLKSVHRPRSARAYHDAAVAFLDGLRGGAPLDPDPLDPDPLDPDQLARQTGCLLLARVDGKSPAEYLTAAEQPVVRALGRRVLTDRPATVTDAWEWLT